MDAGRLCQLEHDNHQDHVVTKPVGVITSRGPVLYADRACAARQGVDADQLTDPLLADADWIRS
ncbi:hypothetical protein ACQP2Y_21300 [Actinoplanes sp. CA-051413]|uniref:hypothetical protein n=1 Tax=Actinoplanes sp. CA-051413 TaxID=3239899 RepID=UPI003D96E446